MDARDSTTAADESSDDGGYGSGKRKTEHADESVSLQRQGLKAIGNTLDSFRHVVSLDLSRNLLTHLDGIERLEKLRVLSVYLNKIEDGRVVQKLVGNKCLVNLDMRLNPIVKGTWYRYFVLQNLPELKVLDEQPVAAYERRKCINIPTISLSDLKFRDDDESSEDEIEAVEEPRPVVPKDALETSISDVEFEDFSANEDNGGDEEENSFEVEEDLSVGASVDHSLLSVLRYIRRMKMPIGTSEWATTMDGLNERLVQLVNCRKEEKVDKESQDALLDAHVVEKKRLEAKVEELVTENARLDAERVTATTKVKAMIKSKPPPVKAASVAVQTTSFQQPVSTQEAEDMTSITEKVAENDIHSQVPAMLLEAHNALIQANRALLVELDDIKSRYSADELQWKRNFERLEKYHETMSCGEIESPEAGVDHK
uniref:U2A'/phosphoprotein 32 family A C-terminal domain-containing protein n=1 Tax=Mucochytrium quahogii TaxID=96639 RepID=A0A7S2RKC3_9STRA|mmetsp:Transcript_16468/g.35932  ORF Transcript_16468/g.35932 Transcript_16468/m.35932 type:complete len:428 (+) Transcript_16468:154-1437(+)